MSNETKKNAWKDYYEVWRGRECSKLLVKTLNACESFIEVSQAVDLGAGTGRDTFELLKRGWKVLAIDCEKESIQIIVEDTPKEFKANLTTQVGKFSEVKLPNNKLIVASFSLFFSELNQFKTTWDLILKSQDKNAVFAGTFLGVKDSWNSRNGITTSTKEQIVEMMSSFDIISLDEEEYDGETANKKSKHWHYFSVIGRKK